MSLEARYRPITLYRAAQGASAVDEPTRELVGVYRGYIQPISGSETTQAEGLREMRTHRMYTLATTPIQFGDEIEQDEIVYRAVFTLQPAGISSVKHHKEIDLQYVGR